MTKPKKYLTKPLPSPTMPGGIPYIVANEAAERFSFYGMSAILTIFLTKYLMGTGGKLDPMSPNDAAICYHNFAAAVYFFPILGALVSDGLLGKYRTILSFSIIYCLGHLALASDDTRLGLFIGLGLIAFGAGGIKPCVSAHVGDQFGRENQHLLEKVFGWFYFSINLGGFVSQLLIPVLLTNYGPHVAFGVPGLLMLLATVCFWLGRNKFVHIPPGGLRFVREALSGVGLRAIGRLLVVYMFVAVFFALPPLQALFQQSRFSTNNRDAHPARHQRP
jgi:POT family proton-dependent oligopeptide transporter